MQSSGNQSMISVGALGFVLGYALCLLKQKRELDLSTSPLTSLTSGNSKSSPIGESIDYISKTGCVYLDYNATTPIYPEVASVISQHLDVFGNPSSPHVFARRSKQSIDNARRLMKQLIGCSSEEEILFTSCGSESDNRAIDMAIHHYHKYKHTGAYSTEASASKATPCVITSSIEHPAVICYLHTLVAKKVIRLVILPVTSEGVVEPAVVEAALASNAGCVALVTIMHSNNEIGTIMPIRAIAAKIREHNKRMLESGNSNSPVLFHTDAAQSISKVPVDVAVLGVDMMTIVGHKMGAPKGIAALYVKSGVTTCQMLVGGGQEFGIRAGTENTLLISAIGEAARIYMKEAESLLIHLLQLKHKMIAILSSDSRLKEAESRLTAQGKLKQPLVKFNGPRRSCDAAEISKDIGMLKMISKLSGFSDPNSPSSSSTNEPSISLDQLPNTVSVSFCHVPAHEIIDRLTEKVAVSAGSACHAKDAGHKPSLVLTNISLGEEFDEAAEISRKADPQPSLLPPDAVAGPIQSHSFNFDCDSCRISGHFIKLKKSLFLVLGDEVSGGDSKLDSLAMSMPTRFDRMPLSTTLIANDNSSELRDAISIQLAKKYNIQAFVSCKIDTTRYDKDPDSELGTSSLLLDILGHLFKIIGPLYR